jgi:hypothetical protein
MPDIDLVKIDKSDASPKVKEVYKLLKKYMDQPERRQWLDRRNDNWDSVYEDGERSTIWSEKERKAMAEKDMIPLMVNDLYKGVQGSSAVVTDQKPGVEFLPVGSGDLYVAELMKRAHDQTWAQNDGGTEIYDYVREAKIGGLAFLNSRHDPAKGLFGKLIFGNTDPTTVYFDMMKSKKADLSDTPVIIAHLVSKTYAKETYDDIKDEDLAFDSVPKPEDSTKSDTVTGADNYTMGEKPDAPEGPTDLKEEKEDIWEIEAHLLKREKELWLMIPDENGDYIRKVYTKDQQKEAEEALKTVQALSPHAVLWKRVVEKRVMRIICGKKLIPQIVDNEEVDENVNPYGIDIDGDPVLPVVALMPERTRKGKPVAPTTFAKESCRERNKRRSQAIYVVSKNVDAPIVSIGEIKWHKDPIHGDWGEVDKGAPAMPQRLSPGSVSTEALNMEAIAKADVDEIYDMQDVMKGRIPKGDPSGRTILALMDTAGMMTKPFTRALESALVRVGKVNMSIILKTWQRKQWERLIEEDEMSTWQPKKDRKPTNPMEEMNALPGEAQEGPDNQTKQEISQKWAKALELIRPEDDQKEPGISLLDIDVRVAAGSTMPTNRMAKAAVALDYVKNGIYDQEAALDYIDDPHKDEIVARLKEREKVAMQAALMGEK